MKKAFIIFAALFIAYASIGYFFAIDKSFRNELITKFGNSAYITAKPLTQIGRASCRERV